MDGEVRINPYLGGNFAPVRSEDDFELTVRGVLPPGLSGVLYRNGPNPQFEPRDGAYHWFLGDGMIHAFTVGEGRVTYRNRWVRTPRWEAEHAAGQALWGAWGNPMTTDPSVLGVVESAVANTNIVHHAGRLMALVESSAPFAIAEHELGPKGFVDFGGRVTAHPKTDPETGEMVFFAYADDPMPLSNKVSWGVVGADGRLVRRETFEAPYCSMIHDCAVTPNYLLVPVLPLTGNLQRAMSGGPIFAWEPEVGGRMAVIPRAEGVAGLRWLPAPEGYVFHVMNAFEEGSAVVVDVMRYASAPLFPRADGRPGENAAAYLVRWTFDLETGSVTEAPLDDLAGEFPRFDERFSGLPYRHGWFAGQSRKSGDMRTDSIAHIDLATGRRSVFVLPEGDAVSEPVFTPAGPDASEGEGWLTAVVYRGAEHVSEFVVLDAQDVAAGPVASAKLPRRVPFGFHGNWVNA